MYPNHQLPLSKAHKLAAMSNMVANKRYVEQVAVARRSHRSCTSSDLLRACALLRSQLEADMKKLMPSISFQTTAGWSLGDWGADGNVPLKDMLQLKHEFNFNWYPLNFIWN